MKLITDFNMIKIGFKVGLHNAVHYILKQKGMRLRDNGMGFFLFRFIFSLWKYFYYHDMFYYFCIYQIISFLYCTCWALLWSCQQNYRFLVWYLYHYCTVLKHESIMLLFYVILVYMLYKYVYYSFIWYFNFYVSI